MSDEMFAAIERLFAEIDWTMPGMNLLAMRKRKDSVLQTMFVIEAMQSLIDDLQSIKRRNAQNLSALRVPIVDGRLAPQMCQRPVPIGCSRRASILHLHDNIFIYDMVFKSDRHRSDYGGILPHCDSCHRAMGENRIVYPHQLIRIYAGWST